MITKISVRKILEGKSAQKESYFTLPFYENGSPLKSSAAEKHGRWGMTLLSAGSMRFRWNESNERRDATLKKILEDYKAHNSAQDRDWFKSAEKTLEELTKELNK